MKKATAIGSVILLAVISAACASGTGLKSGAAAGEALIKMMPKAATGVMAFDVQRLMGTEGVRTALQDPKVKDKFDEYVRLSGIDPAKDIFYVGVGITGSPVGAAKDAGAGVVVSLKYDKAKLQALIKEKAPEVKEEIYNGVTVYSNIDGGKDMKQATGAAFLDETHIILGTEAGLKGLIDVHQKKAESLAKNTEMAVPLKAVDKSGLLWGAFAVPQELIKKGVESTPQLKPLEGVKALTLALDDRVSGVVADIRTLGGTKEQNANLAAALNGFKAMGAMFGAQEPVIGEVLNGIQISSGDDYTRLALTISHEILNKLGELAKSKAGDLKKDDKKDDVPAEGAIK
jgi:hypothetical protein